MSFVPLGTYTETLIISIKEAVLLSHSLLKMEKSVSRHPCSSRAASQLSWGGIHPQEVNQREACPRSSVTSVAERPGSSAPRESTFQVPMGGLPDSLQLDGQFFIGPSRWESCTGTPSTGVPAPGTLQGREGDVGKDHHQEQLLARTSHQRFWTPLISNTTRNLRALTLLLQLRTPQGKQPPDRHFCLQTFFCNPCCWHLTVTATLYQFICRGNGSVH